MENEMTIESLTSVLIKAIDEHRLDVPEEVMKAQYALKRALEWYQKDLGSQLIAANRDAAQKMKDETKQAYEIEKRMMEERGE